MKREHLEKITELRHELHRYPELSMQERETKRRLMEFIERETKLEVVDLGKWFYALCPGRKSLQRGLSGITPEPALSSAIAFRADFDALPIGEDSGLSYASLNPGVSHRCGHDGHSAALAGLALELTPGEYVQDIYLIFQHGEEIGGGGAECASLVREKGIGHVFAFHNWSGFPERCILVREGITQCASKGFTVFFTGKTAHASQPEDGINPARAVSELVLLMEKTAGMPDYEALVMVTVVEVSVGSRNFGIAASKGSVSATLRAGYDTDMKKLEGRIRDAAERLAARDGLSVEYSECDVFPDTVNGASSAELVRRAAKAAGLAVQELEEPFRASEDFGYYLKECSGAMFYIGNGVQYPQIHTVTYDFNDRILETAVEMFEQILRLTNSGRKNGKESGVDESGRNEPEKNKETE